MDKWADDCCDIRKTPRTLNEAYGPHAELHVCDDRPFMKKHIDAIIMVVSVLIFLGLVCSGFVSQ